MDFEAIHTYATAHSQPERQDLQALRRRTHLEVLKPRMLSGALQANVLQMMVRMVEPQRVLEVGTYTGYATLAMAAALPEGGHIHTIERNEELHDRVEQTFGESPWHERITTHWGKAARIIDALSMSFDMVFLDADKENYLNYYHQLRPKMHPGGWIIADNVLWSGKVLHPEQNKDKKTQALMAFTKQVHRDSQQGFHVLLPIRDGLLVIQTKKSYENNA